MSHATIAVTPASQLLLNLMMPAVAVGAAGFAVTAGAVLASRKLRCDYEKAKTEFEERCLQDEKAIQQQMDRQSVLAIASSSFGANIEAGSENTTLTFIRQSLSDLAIRAEAAGQTATSQLAADLSSQVAAESMAETLQAYFGLSDQLEAAILASARQSGDYSLVFDAIRIELDSPALAGSRHQQLKLEFEDQLVKLEAVGDRGGSVVRQGTENLKSRIRREISDQTERQVRENQERRYRRDVVAEAFALIRAVMQASDDPDERTRAAALLNQLGAAFQAGAPPTVSELEALLSKARSLFGRCEKRLEDAASHAFVAESVKDVLLTMGYQVSEVPSEIANGDPGCMVSIDNDSGVVVSLNSEGKMLTEMVAFTSAGQDPDDAAEKRVCAVVDDILAGLRSRDIPMQDKSRKKLRPGHRLRMVKKSKPQELAAPTSSKARAIE